MYWTLVVDATTTIGDVQSIIVDKLGEQQVCAPHINEEVLFICFRSLVVYYPCSWKLLTITLTTQLKLEKMRKYWHLSLD